MTAPLALDVDGQNGTPPARNCEDLTAHNVETIVRLEDAAKAKRTRSDRVADAIPGSVPRCPRRARAHHVGTNGA